MSRATRKLKRITALVVEDDEQAMKFITMVLMDMGMTQLFTAADGMEAWETLNDHRDEIDVVICDWNLPRLSGLEMLERMREERIVTPFLMLTGRGTMESAIEACSTGVDSSLPKPFAPEQLLRKLLPLVGLDPSYVTV